MGSVQERRIYRALRDEYGEKLTGPDGAPVMPDRDDRDTWPVVWLGRYVDSTGKERTRTFEEAKHKGRGRQPATAERRAWKWVHEQEAKVDQGRDEPRTLAKLTVGALADEWLESRGGEVKASTARRYRQLVETHIRPRWGRTPVSKVDRAGVRSWVAGLGRPAADRDALAASTIRQTFVVFNAVMERAVTDSGLPSNPCRGVKPPRLPSKAERGMRALTEPEVWALAGEAGHYGAMVAALAWAGLRFGEAAALQVGDLSVVTTIDEDGVETARGALRVSKTLSEVGGTLVESTPKTEGSARTVPVPAWLTAELVGLCEGRDESARLFTAPEGGEVRLRNFRRAFDLAVKRAGITAKGGTAVRPHDLRHTCASLHIDAGTPAKVLSELLGHSSIAITLDRYGHLYPGTAAAWVDVLGERAEASRAEWRRNELGAAVIPLPSVGAV